MPHWTPELKHNLLLEYRDDDPNYGFAALARRHPPLKERTMAKWHKGWDRTAASLERRAGSGRPPLIEPALRDKVIRSTINEANRRHEAIHHPEVGEVLAETTGVHAAPRTVRHWGEQLLAHERATIPRSVDQRQCITHIVSSYVHSICSMLTWFCVLFLFCGCIVSADHCEQVAEVRRDIQQFPKQGLLILDETAVKLGMYPRTTITLEGNTPYVTTSHTGHYGPRYDMISCIHFNGVFEPMIIAPEMRSEAGGAGITTYALCSYLSNSVAPAAAQLGVSRLGLVLDKASIHSTQRVIDAFAQGGVHLEKVWKLPTASSNRASPLDNTLFHEWKERIRNHRGLSENNVVELMLDSWQQTSVQSIHHYYHLCGLLRRNDPLYDCPAPAEHQH